LPFKACRTLAMMILPMLAYQTRQTTRVGRRSSLVGTAGFPAKTRPFWMQSDVSLF